MASKLTELGLYGLTRDDVDGYAGRISAVDASQLRQAIANYPTRVEVPVVGLSVLILIMAQDGYIGTLDGLLLTGGLIAYTVFAIWQSRRETAAVQAEYDDDFGKSPTGWLARLPAQIACILLGLCLGATWLVDSAVAIAGSLQISEMVIGLTIVAAGTSFPELATSVVAAFRGEGDIAVGNVIGSSIFNLRILASLHWSHLAGCPFSGMNFDIPVMIAVAFACLPIFATGHRIARWEGVMFLGYYAVYLAYLVLAATQHDNLQSFSSTMLGFVLPLTGVTLLALWAQHRTQKNSI